MTEEHTDDGEAAESTRRDFMKTGALASGALVLGTGAVVNAQRNGGGDVSADVEDANAQPQAEARFSSVEFTNQQSDGSQVTVNSTMLSQSGYVAFHDPSLLQGAVVDSVVGVTDYLEGGIHYTTEASLFDVPGGEFEQSELQETTPIIAMPHRETSGNEEYNFVESGGEEDGPFIESQLPVVDLAYVGVDSGEGGTATGTPTETETATQTPTGTPAEDGTETPTGTEAATRGGEGAAEPFASVDFENQVITEDEVTVGEAVLSRGGFVALHDARLFEGKPFESVVGVSDYLDPGRHRKVTVEIEEPSALTEVALPVPPLVPMPHRDTNGNERYEFASSEGEYDPPYTQAGNPVVDLGLVIPEPQIGGTPTGTMTATEDGGLGNETDTPTE